MLKVYLPLFVQARVLSDSCATMALDHKGRVVYATDKLAAMLGYPVTSLVKMDLNALLPQPYCQMHSAWFKVGFSPGSRLSCLFLLTIRLLILHN